VNTLRFGFISAAAGALSLLESQVNAAGVVEEKVRVFRGVAEAGDDGWLLSAVPVRIGRA